MPFPPSHGDQITEPHVGDFVGNDVRRPHPLRLRCLLRIEEQQYLAEGDATEVLHSAESEVGDGHEIQLLAGVGDVVILGEMAQGEGADLQCEFRQVALADRVHDAQRHAVHVHRLGGLERADDEGHEIGGHFHGVVEGHQAPAVASGRFGNDGGVGDGVQVVRHDQGDAEHGLEVRLVEARKGAAGVGAFKLRGGDVVLFAVAVFEFGKVKSVQLVVEDALEAQHQAIIARRQGGAKPEPQAFLVCQQFCLRTAHVVAVGVFQGGGDDFQFGGVQPDGVGGLDYLKGDDDRAGKGRLLQVGLQGEIVTRRYDVAGQLVRIQVFGHAGDPFSDGCYTEGPYKVPSPSGEGVE